MSLESREGTRRDIQASDPRSGSAEVTVTCKVGGQQPRLAAANREPSTIKPCTCPWDYKPATCQHKYALRDCLIAESQSDASGVT